jgi:hypothetical protein
MGYVKAQIEAHSTAVDWFGIKLNASVQFDGPSAIAASRKLWGHNSQLNQQSLSNDHYMPQQYLDAGRGGAGVG